MEYRDLDLNIDHISYMSFDEAIEHFKAMKEKHGGNASFIISYQSIDNRCNKLEREFAMEKFKSNPWFIEGVASIERGFNLINEVVFFKFEEEERQSARSQIRNSKFRDWYDWGDGEQDDLDNEHL